MAGPAEAQEARKPTSELACPIRVWSELFQHNKSNYPYSVSPWNESFFPFREMCADYPAMASKDLGITALVIARLCGIGRCGGYSENLLQMV